MSVSKGQKVSDFWVNIPTQWSSATNASGYIVSSRTMTSDGQSWTDLPYPVTTLGWTFNWAPIGTYQQFRVKPSRGFLSGAWTYTTPGRILGVPWNRAYAALGDSYSSGLGSESSYSSYSGGSCYRTKNAWVYKLETDWNIAVGHFACAGATTADLTYQIGGAQVFMAQNPGRPQLVTLTVGGNDIGFADELKKCVTSSCLNRSAAIDAAIERLRPNLSHRYSELRSKFPYSDILVGGYPVLIEPSGPLPNIACVGLDRGERDLIAAKVGYLDDVIDLESALSGVWSVRRRPIAQFAGHGACAGLPFSQQEWINSVSDPWIMGWLGRIVSIQIPLDRSVTRSPSTRNFK